MIIEGKLFPYKRKITKLFELAGEILKEDFASVNVSVNFVGEDEIKDLNKIYRNIDRVTDVLSFPNLNKSPEQNLTEFENERSLNDGVLFLGDIVICRAKAKAQAKEYGHSEKREVCFLALHGLLHLLGYDHMNEEDEKLMQGKAEEILNRFGARR